MSYRPAQIGRSAAEGGGDEVVTDGDSVVRAGAFGDDGGVGGDRKGGG